MAGVSLSRQDIDILGKILDPEASADGAPRLDASLPKDPHVTDAEEYAQVSQRERDLVLALQQADMQLAGFGQKTLSDPIAAYRTAVSGLADLIARYPRYASAMNNRAQALRRLYGDDILLARAEEAPKDEDDAAAPSSNASTKTPPAILQGQAATSAERADAAATVLSDLDRAVALLMPASSPSSPTPAPAALSPTANRTLSQALTQRAALYYATSKHMASGRACNSQVERPEVRWSKEDFEEAAARNFDLGGRFGNDLARELAVGINPTAKLCGQMVQQMMKDEYDPQV